MPNAVFDFCIGCGERHRLEKWGRYYVCTCCGTPNYICAVFYN